LNAGAFSSEAICSSTFRFPPFPAIPVQFARVFQSATGIIVFSQVVIATSTDAEKLIDDVEDLLCATGQGQIETRFSVFAQSSDFDLGYGILPAGAQRPSKRRLFCRRLFLVHRGRFSTVPLQLIFATA
jgi:hypothetical protein